jgi:predicted NBD/HSP70 family sugar kinase
MSCLSLTTIFAPIQVLKPKLRGTRCHSGFESQPQDPALAELAAVTADETERILAISLVNMCRCYDPRFILLGGGMAEAGEPPLAAVRFHFEAIRWTVLPDHAQINNAHISAVLF